MSVIDEILDRLKNQKDLSEARRASLEYELYDLVQDPSGKKAARGDRPEYLRRVFGLNFYEMKHRLTLNLAGSVTDPYWNLLDTKELLLGTAVRLLREARRRSQQKGTSLDVEVEEGLISWEDRSTVCKNKTTGRSYRRKVNPRTAPPITEALEKIRACARDYADRKASHLDTRTKRRLVNEMMADIDAALGSLLHRIQREDAKAASAAASAARNTPRRAVVEACEALHIRPPTPTKPLDMNEVSTRFWALVKKYHPDVTGNEDSRALYEQVVQARETLKRYFEEQGEIAP